MKSGNEVREGHVHEATERAAGDPEAEASGKAAPAERSKAEAADRAAPARDPNTEASVSAAPVAVT